MSQAIEVRIPPMLRRLTKEAATVRAEGSTVGEIIDFLESGNSGIRGELLDETGQIHRFVNIYLNDEDVRFINKLNTPVAPGDVISILPAVAGGSDPAFLRADTGRP